jgi:hypothetical protein
MEITKESALELLDEWLTKAYSFPKHEAVIKITNLDCKSDVIFDDYAFTQLLCVAYDLEPKQKL